MVGVMIHFESKIEKKWLKILLIAQTTTLNG